MQVRGLNGRTTEFDERKFTGFANPRADRSGIDQIQLAIEEVFPVDMIVIMLGTNDLKPAFNMSAKEIAERLGELVDIAKQKVGTLQHQLPEIVIVSPVILNQAVENDSDFTGHANEAIEKSTQLATHYKQVAEEKGCLFFDATEVQGVRTSYVDGVHLDAGAHKALGLSLATHVAPILQSANTLALIEHRNFNGVSFFSEYRTVAGDSLGRFSQSSSLSSEAVKMLIEDADRCSSTTKSLDRLFLGKRQLLRKNYSISTSDGSIGFYEDTSSQYSSTGKQTLT